MRLHKNNTSLKTNTILSHMLRKNLEVIVLDLKKSTNGRKQIVKFIIVKISFFLRLFNGDHLKIKLSVLQECQHI